MKMNVLLSGTCIAVAALASTCAAEDKKHQEHSEQSPMAAQIARRTGAEFESAYLGLMTLHHKAGQPMWEMAREKSKNSEILALEKKTTPKEQQEIQQMTGWLKAWHNKTPEDFQVPEESKKKMAADMEELKSATGKEFDALFAKKMAQHHMGAIETGKLAAEKAQHSEVKASAEQIARSQTEDRQKLLGIAKGAKE